MAVGAVVIGIGLAARKGGGKLHGAHAVSAAIGQNAKSHEPSTDSLCSETLLCEDFVLSNGDGGTVYVLGTVGYAQALIERGTAPAKAFHVSAHPWRDGNVVIGWSETPNPADESFAKTITK